MFLGGRDGDDEDRATEAVQVVVIIPKHIPGAFFVVDAETGVEILWVVPGHEVTGAADPIVMNWLEAQRFFARVFYGDVAAVQFYHPTEHAVGTVHGFFALPPFGGDATV